MTLERFLNEGKLKEIIIGFEGNREIQNPIGFLIFKGLDLVQILS